MESSPVTQLLMAWSKGDAAALEQLVPLVQAELKRIARHYLRQEKPGHLLQTTALVNEAWVRLIDWHHVNWQNRAHFFSVAAQLMRRVLVDEARERQTQKRGGAALRVSFSAAANVVVEQSAELLALDAALHKLTKLDARKSRIVELRFFGGLSIEETAEVLQVSPRTVLRDWSFAQTWLFHELSPSGASHE
ncbi:MAG TPA: sigma-70 family RNA polymerase sigma factor [Blastocatellia bacterium]|nr:sigma-70 family RNA polymerase sigma factor [Blastocatellia bacterium]